MVGAPTTILVHEVTLECKIRYIKLERICVLDTLDPLYQIYIDYFAAFMHEKNKILSILRNSSLRFSVMLC